MPELIDANALKSELCSGCSTRCVTVCETIRIINKQPTIKAEPVRQGMWVVRGQEIYCSECSVESLYNPFGASKFSDFCPNCGAKMDGGAENG